MTDPRFQDTIRLSADGLAKVLGDLETRIMRSVWCLGRPVPARAVHEAVVLEHDVTLLTVITVLNKLVEKGLLRRRKQDSLLHYETTLSEAELRAFAARKMVDGILSFGPAALAACFVDALAESDPEHLLELERMVRDRLQGRAGS